MDSTTSPKNVETETQSSPSTQEDLFSSKNTVIIVLVSLLVLSFLGINLLVMTGDALQSVISIFKPAVDNILGTLGYTTGTVIDKSADVVGDTAKLGIDIAEGAVHSVGKLLKPSGNNDQLNQSLNKSNGPPTNPSPDNATNSIQNPIASNKGAWCLVGQYGANRGCIQVDDQDKCLSGQIFPNQKLCLNPTLTQNAW
jgi:hypothetical protein